MDDANIHLQTWIKQYNIPQRPTPPTQDQSTTLNMPLHIPWLYPTPKMERQPLQCMAHNPHAKDSHNYNVVYVLEQWLVVMSALEVLQTFPSQWKDLFSDLRDIDPSDSWLLTFDLDQSSHSLPSTMSLQIQINIHNITIHRCIVDEDTSTCIMSTQIWNDLSSLDVTHSNITLHAYDGQPSQFWGLYKNVPMTLAGKP